MPTKQELFTKVTGLTYDLEKISDKTKLAWLVPDGSMLNNEEGRKAIDTKAFLEAADIDVKSKIELYDDEEESSGSGSNE